MLSAGVEGAGINAVSLPAAGVMVALVVLLRRVRPKNLKETSYIIKTLLNYIPLAATESSALGIFGVAGPTEADFPVVFVSDLFVPSSLTLSSAGKCLTVVRA